MVVCRSHCTVVVSFQFCQGSSQQEQLQSLVTNFATVKSQHAALIGVTQVVTILTDGVLLFSELQSELKSLPPKDETDEKIPIRARLQWARKEGSLNALIGRLQSFKNSMTLVLMILKSLWT